MWLHEDIKEKDMRKSTKNALLIALFSQKPNKNDATFVYCASIIIATLLLIGAMQESTFLFRTSLGLIVAAPFTRGAYVGYKKHKEGSWETAYSILLWISAFSGFFFIIGLTGSMPEMVTFPFLGLIAVPIVSGIIEGKEM